MIHYIDVGKLSRKEAEEKLNEVRIKMGLNPINSSMNMIFIGICLAILSNIL